MRTAIFAAAIALASPAFAQAGPDAATLAAARELMRITDVQGQMRAIGPRLAEATGQQMRLMFKDDAMPDGLRTELTAAVQAYIGSMDSIFTPTFIDQMAVLYARHFTADELRRIITLTKDPVMEKFRTEMPALMSEMMPLIFEAMKPGQEQFMAKIKQIVADWMAKHPQDKAKLRSPIAS